jgi:hypothetical protein
MGEAPAGAGSEFCASAEAATTPHSVVAIVSAKIRLLMLLPALARADELRALAWR